SFLKLKARSRAPEFAYIHALPAPYKGTTEGIDRIYTKATRKRVMSKRFVYITFSHLADTFVQSDVQGIEQSSYEQQRPSVTINTTLHKELKKRNRKKKKCRNVTAV